MGGALGNNPVTSRFPICMNLEVHVQCNCRVIFKQDTHVKLVGAACVCFYIREYIFNSVNENTEFGFNHLLFPEDNSYSILYIGFRYK